MKELLLVLLMLVCAVSAFYSIYLFVKLSKHMKEGYTMHLWNGAWIFDESSVEPAGQVFRKRLAFLFLVVPLVTFGLFYAIDKYF